MAMHITPLDGRGRYVDPRTGIYELRPAEMYVNDTGQPIYLDAAGKATTDPERGVTLLLGPNCQMPLADAAEVGVLKLKATKAIAGPAETKGEGNHGG